MSIIKIVRVLYITTFLIGCSGAVKSNPSGTSYFNTPSISPTNTHETVLTIDKTPLMSQTQTLRASSIIPVPIITETPSTSIPLDTRLNIHCLEVFPELPPEALVEGVIVFDNRTLQNDTILIDIVKNIKVSVPEEENQHLFDFRVSPDNTLLAFVKVTQEAESHEINNRQLVVMTADGLEREAISWEKGWVALSRWLDNDNLIVSSGDEKKESLISLNPFTGEYSVLPIGFPDIYPYQPSPDYNNSGMTVYDPTLTLVVYPGLGEDFHSLTDYVYALRSIEIDQIVSTVQSYDYTHEPVWSLDGERLAIAATTNPNNFFEFELYVVEKKGKINQVTNLSSYFQSLDIKKYAWSPSGQMIAFWLTPVESGPTGSEQLAVLDLNTQEVTLYCIQGDYDQWGQKVVPMFGTPIPPPIWSPDGHQLIVENRYDREASRVILVDMINNYAAVIAENMEPIGWLKSDN